MAAGRARRRTIRVQINKSPQSLCPQSCGAGAAAAPSLLTCLCREVTTRAAGRGRMLRRRPTVRADRNPLDSAPVPRKAGLWSEGGFPQCFSGRPHRHGQLPSPDSRLHGDLQGGRLVLSSAGHAQAHVHSGTAGGGIGGHPSIAPAVATTIWAAAVGTVKGAVGVWAGGDAVRGWVRLGAPQAGFAVLDQHGHCHPPRGQRVGSQLQGFILPLPLALVPSVLEPDFHLGGGELEHTGEVLPFRRREVFLLLKSSLQFKHLSLGEQDSGFSPLPLLRVVAGLSFLLLCLEGVGEQTFSCSKKNPKQCDPQVRFCFQQVCF